MKTCKGCQIKKEAEEFYKSDHMADGRLNYCRSCFSLRHKKKRQERRQTPEYKQKQKMHAKKHNKSIKRRKAISKWQKENALAHKAHLIVHAYKQAKLLKPKPCVLCDSKNTQAHHFDYTKPLKVVWLCAFHHNQLHRNEVSSAQYEAIQRAKMARGPSL